MSVTATPGTRIYSTVCTAEFITVKAPADPIELTVGGVPATTEPPADRGGSIAEGHDGGAAVGKRYTDEAGTIELLCTKAGDGVPGVDGAALVIKGAKPLPSSD